MKENDETLNRNPSGLFDRLGHWRWHGCTLGGMVVNMKMRQHKRLILARIKADKKYIWFVWPMMIRAEMAKKTHQRIRAIVDAAFPEAT
jgi:hypothetical protein